MDALPVDDNPPPHVHRQSWLALLVVAVLFFSSVLVALMVSGR